MTDRISRAHDTQINGLAVAGVAYDSVTLGT